MALVPTVGTEAWELDHKYLRTLLGVQTQAQLMIIYQEIEIKFSVIAGGAANTTTPAIPFNTAQTCDVHVNILWLDEGMHRNKAPRTIIPPIKITDFRRPLDLKNHSTGSNARIFIILAQLPSNAIVVSSQ